MKDCRLPEIGQSESGDESWVHNRHLYTYLKRIRQPRYNLSWEGRFVLSTTTTTTTPHSITVGLFVLQGRSRALFPLKIR